MSRGRPRHQASRRRTYISRMRDLRDRRARLASEDPAGTDEAIAFEIEEHLDFEAPTSWATRLDGRPSAA
jgi:hypothetical protein